MLNERVKSFRFTYIIPTPTAGSSFVIPFPIQGIIKSMKVVDWNIAGTGSFVLWSQFGENMGQIGVNWSLAEPNPYRYFMKANQAGGASPVPVSELVTVSGGGFVTAGQSGDVIVYWE